MQYDVLKYRCNSPEKNKLVKKFIFGCFVLPYLNYLNEWIVLPLSLTKKYICQEIINFVTSF